MEPPLHITYPVTLAVTSPDWLLFIIPSPLLGAAGQSALSGTLNNLPFEGVALPSAAGYRVMVGRELAERLGLLEGGQATLDCDVLPMITEHLVQHSLTEQSSSLSLPSLLPEGLPPEIKGWNWGALLLGVVWGPYYGVWSGLLFILPYLSFFGSSFTAISVIGLIISIPLSAQFARKGNEWAWKNRKWESVQQFKSVQRTWALWGILGSVALTLAVGVVLWQFYKNLYSGNLDGLDQINSSTLQGLDLNGL